MAIWFGLLTTPCAAAETPALVAVIMDDLGNARTEAERAAALPGAITCSILPHTPYAELAAKACIDAGKDVFVHLPMQPEDPTARPGPGVLLVGQTRNQLRQIVRSDLDSVPGAIGVNNHMGSLLTRHIAYMEWFMAELAGRGGLLFVDSATTAESMAQRLAGNHGVPATRRDVFLDEDPAPEAVRVQWERLIQLALAEGTALAIGHPREATLALLAEQMDGLQSRGIILVSVAELVRARDEGGSATWQEFSSR